MSEPVARMLERLDVLVKVLQSEAPVRSFSVQEEILSIAVEAAPRLLGLVRAGEALREWLRHGAIEGDSTLLEAVRTWDEASRGAGQRGEGTP